MTCSYCGKPLSILKKIMAQSFCSPAHHQQYEAQFAALQLQRLIDGLNIEAGTGDQRASFRAEPVELPTTVSAAAA